MLKSDSEEKEELHLDIESIVTDLEAERDRLDKAIAALRGTAVGNGRRGRRRLSAAARKRISAAMKARWAKRKRAAG